MEALAIDYFRMKLPCRSTEWLFLLLLSLVQRRLKGVRHVFPRFAKKEAVIFVFLSFIVLVLSKIIVLNARALQNAVRAHSNFTLACNIPLKNLLHRLSLS